MEEMTYSFGTALEKALREVQRGEKDSTLTIVLPRVRKPDLWANIQAAHKERQAALKLLQQL